MAFFTELGVSLKTERGNRVFPTSDRAADIIDALVRELRRQKVTTVHGRVSHIQTEDGHATGVTLEDGRKLTSQAVILATGGASYPATGSTGDGYRLASELGHTVTDLQGSLVPLEAKGEDCPRMQGLALKNVRVKVVNQKKKVAYEGFGELLFTHFGLSGPLILSASAHLTKLDKNQYTVIIDLKPALEEKKLDERLVREFQAQANKDFQNALGQPLAPADDSCYHRAHRHPVGRPKYMTLTRWPAAGAVGSSSKGSGWTSRGCVRWRRPSSPPAA